MMCEKTKKLINGYSELKELDKKEVDLHLANCPSCKKELGWHMVSMQIFRQTLAFKDENMSWGNFVDQLPLMARPQSRIGWLREKLNNIIDIITTPVWGPVPVYAFSILLLFGIGLGFYSTFARQANDNLKNIIIYDREYLSSTDNGEETIYFGQK